MHDILTILAIAGVAALFLILSPTAACSCTRRPCPRCGGTGRRIRLGARLVHRGLIKGHKQARRRGRQAR